MAKKCFLVTLILMLLVTVVVGCSTPSTSNSGDAENTNTSPKNLTDQPISLGGNYVLATAGTAGTFFPYGGALCQIINKEIGTNITAISTGGGIENIALLANEEVDFALLDADMMSYALTGTEKYKDKKVSTFGSIASLFPQVIHIVVAKNSDINSITDLKGKRVSVGDAGSGTAVNAAQILDAHGITFDDFNVYYLSFKESASAFQDNSLDAFVGVAGMPTTAVTEVSVVKDIRLLSIDQKYMEILTDRYSFFAPITIGKDVYNTSNDTKTLAVNATVVALNSVSEDVVYHFTKAMFENIDDLAEAHAKGRDLSLEVALDGIDVNYLHPGAAKFYEEKGMLK